MTPASPRRCAKRAGIYEEVNANVLVVGDYKAFNKDRVEQLVEIVNVKVRCFALFCSGSCKCGCCDAEPSCISGLLCCLSAQPTQKNMPVRDARL